MKKALLIIVLAVCFANCANTGKSGEGEKNLATALADAASAIQTQLAARTEIALAECDASPVKLAQYLDSQLSDKLVTSGLTVLARGESLKTVYDEQNFQMSGFVSDESVVGIGHMLGAKSMVVCSFDDLGAFYQYMVRVINVRTSAVEVSFITRVSKDDRDISVLLGNTGRAARRNIREEAVVRYNQGIENHKAGVYALAVEEFDNAIRINKNFTAAYLRRGLSNVYIDYDKAIADFTHVIKLDRNNILAHFNRAVVHELKRNNRSAIADFTEVIRLDPDYVYAYLFRGDMYWRTEDYDRAIADYTKVINMKPKETVSYYNRAYIYSLKKQFDRVIADYTSIINLNPNDKEGYYFRGETYYNPIYTEDNKRENYDKAIADFTKIIELDPNDADAYYLRGMVYNEKKDYQLAEADLKAAVRINPNFIDVYIVLSRLYEGQENYDQVIAILTTALGINEEIYHRYQFQYKSPLLKREEDHVQLDTRLSLLVNKSYSRSAIYNNRGHAYFNINDMERAIADYAEALRLEPNDATARGNLSGVYFYRGNEYLNTGNYDLAIAEYTKAIQVKPDFAPAYNNRGNAYVGIYDYDRAIADYTQAIRIDSNFADPYYNRGEMYRSEYDYDRAIADYTQAIRIDPNHAHAYNNRGIAYADKGDYDRAIADYTQALRMNPNHIGAYYHRGIAYLSRNRGNDRALAVSDMQAILRLDPTNEGAIMVLNDLQRR